MKFDVYNNDIKRRDCDRKNWFIDGEGNLYYNSDPNGIDMSGKTRIVRAPKHFTYKIIENETL